MLNVFEEVNRDIPFKDIRWCFDHCETISDRSLERVKALGGGIAIQDRMAFKGEYFVDRYGQQAAERTLPVRRMLDFDIPGGRAPMQHAWSAMIPGFPFIGWLPGRQ